MANNRINDAELLTDDELDNVTGGFRLANPINFKPNIPTYIQELVRQAQENSASNQVNSKPRQ